MNVRSLIIAGVFNSLSMVGLAHADNDHAYQMDTSIDKEYLETSYDRSSSNTELKQYLADKGYYPNDLVHSDDSRLLRATIGFVIEDVSGITQDLIMTGFNAKKDDKLENYDSGTLARIQLSLKLHGYLEAPVTAKVDTATLNAIADYAPIGDIETIKNYVESNIPIIFEDGVVRPDTEGIDDMVDQAVQDLTLNNKVTTQYSEPELNRISVDLHEKFSNVSMTHLELQDNEPIVSEGDNVAHYLMANPHERSGAIEIRIKERFLWESARDAIEDSGAKVTLVDAKNEAGAARETWTRDHVLIIGNNVYMPDVKAYELLQKDRGVDDATIEEYASSYLENMEQTAEFLSIKGYDLIKVDGAWFEGGNIVMHDNGETTTLLLGLEDYADSGMGEILTEIISATENQQWNYLPVPLAEQGTYYHLDLALTQQLPNGKHVIYPGVTDAETYKNIVDVMGSDNVVTVSQDTAKDFALNIVVVNDTLITTSSSNELAQIATSMGYSLVGPQSYGEQSFAFGKGGVHCMTNELKK